MTLVEICQTAIYDPAKSWVLFENGTCVILMEPEADLAAQATALLKEWGPVHTGTPAGDFSVVELVDEMGWVVGGHHPDILTFVPLEELESEQPEDYEVGMLGRSKRHADSETLVVIHVEDRRPG